MRIDRLRVENYRRFREVDLELPDGVTALVGRNGSGKSTLLEAIGWCLYGMDAARTEKDLIKRRTASPGDDVRVHVAFRLGPHTFEITRELLGKNGAHVATILVDGKVVVPAGPQSAKESVAYVERALHMDSRGFFTSLVARQRELAALTDARPGDRRKIVLGLLRLDAVDEAITEARTRKRDVTARLAGLRVARLDVPSLKLALDAARAGVEASAASVQRLAASVDEWVERVEDVRSRRDGSRKLAEEHKLALHAIQIAQERRVFAVAQKQRLVLDLARARESGVEAALLAPRLALLPDAKARCDKLAELRVKAGEATRLQNDATLAQQEAARAQEEVAKAEAVLSGGAAIRSLLERALAQRPLLDSHLQLAQQSAADLRARLADAQRLARDAAIRLAAIERLGPETPCPTCTRPLHEHHDRLMHGLVEETRAHAATASDAKLALDAALLAETQRRAALQALTEREAELRGKASGLDRHEALLEGHRRRFTEATARMTRLREVHAALASEPFDPVAQEGAKVELAHLEKDRDRHARLAHVAEREAELAANVVEAQASEGLAVENEALAVRTRDLLAFDAAAHDALERATATGESALAEARIQRERALGEQARRSDEEKRIIAQLAHQQDLAEQAAALEAEARLFERLCGDNGLLLQFKDHLISRIRPMLTAHAGRLFRELTDGRYADLEVAEDYDLLVHDEGESFALARFSGGEADLANLCLRLAVSQVVAERAGSEGFHFLALDEIFGSQDEGRKGNILRALGGLSARFRQIVLITHVDDVKEAAEHVLRVEDLEDGTSRVTVEA